MYKKSNSPLEGIGILTSYWKVSGSSTNVAVNEASFVTNNALGLVVIPSAHPLNV